MDVEIMAEPYWSCSEASTSWCPPWQRRAVLGTTIHSLRTRLVPALRQSPEPFLLVAGAHLQRRVQPQRVWK
jgi:hypothetical protein